MSQDAFEGFDNKPPSQHKYLYAYGNPVYYTDPDGDVVCGGLCIGAVPESTPVKYVPKSEVDKIRKLKGESGGIIHTV